MNARTTPEILEDAEETLSTARLALHDMRDPLRICAVVRSVVVFGRAFTNALQNLRSTEPRFDEWYGPFRAQMEGDELMRYFYELRTKILKQGLLNTTSTVGDLTVPIQLLETTVR